MSNLRFRDLLSSSRAFKVVENDIVSGKLSHAYMFVSEDSKTLSDLFTLISLRVYCKDGGCENCPECARVLSGNHADVRHLFPNKEGKIVVEDVERMIDDTFEASYEGGKKLYFLHDSHKMLPQAQNKFLKTLEEPPQNVTFFIATGSESAILPTIKSRVKKIYLDYFSPRDIAEALGNDEKAKTAGAYSGGLLSSALDVMENGGLSSLTTEVFSALERLKRSSDVPEISLSGIFDSKQSLTDSLSVMELVFRDIMMVASGKKELASFFDMLPRTEELSAFYGAAGAAAIIPKIVEARKKLSVNCTVNNVVDELLYSILEVRHKCQP